MCPEAHHEREARSNLRPGSRTRLIKVPGSSRVLDALLRYLSRNLNPSDTKWGKKHSRSKFRRGGVEAPVAFPPPPLRPLDPPLAGNFDPLIMKVKDSKRLKKSESSMLFYERRSIPVNEYKSLIFLHFQVYSRAQTRRLFEATRAFVRHLFSVSHLL